MRYSSHKIMNRAHRNINEIILDQVVSIFEIWRIIERLNREFDLIDSTLARSQEDHVYFV